MADAYEGYALKNGIKRQSRLSEDDIIELRRMIDEDARKTKTGR